MSRKNHQKVNGQLLQMDKKFSQLKMKQREKIYEWFYEAYHRIFVENKALPNAHQEDEIYFDVVEKINAAGIWIPGHEIEKHFSAKKNDLRKRVLREYGQDIDYDLTLKQVEAFIEAEAHMLPLLSNVSALLNENLRHINWVGFYLLTRDGDLVLGPFQGKPACIHIARGRGVCGTALERNATVRVPNVHEFPGHIACDAASASEIVVPIRDSGGAVKAVLDIDSPMEDRFFERDERNLERLCALLSNAVIWELQ